MVTETNNMSNKIYVHDFTTGESYEREMTDEEKTQAELDSQALKPSDE